MTRQSPLVIDIKAPQRKWAFYLVLTLGGFLEDRGGILLYTVNISIGCIPELIFWVIFFVENRP